MVRHCRTKKNVNKKIAVTCLKESESVEEGSVVVVVVSVVAAVVVITVVTSELCGRH